MIGIAILCGYGKRDTIRSMQQFSDILLEQHQTSRTNTFSYLLKAAQQSIASASTLMSFTTKCDASGSEGTELRLNGEVDKKAHPVLHSAKCAWRYRTCWCMDLDTWRATMP